MHKSRLHGLIDYLALIVRWRWLVAVSFFALCGLSILVSLLLPKIYVSETMILIQPRDVPTDFVKDLIAGTTDERLNAIEQTILSRTNLLRILNEFEGRMVAYRGLNDERKVEKMRKRIVIDVVSEKRQGKFLPTSNFRILYRDQNPELAQLVTARLASLFIEQDAKAREAQVFGTTEFLRGELGKVAEQLKQSETRLRTLKERFRHELPDQLETNLRTLDRLNLQKTANLEALDRHITMQMTLERQLSETPARIYTPVAVKADGTMARLPNPLVDVLRKKEQEYRELQAKATPRHPDIMRLKAELEELRKQIPPEDLAAEQGGVTPLSSPVKTESAAAELAAANAAESAAAGVPNPVYQSLTAQLQQIKTEIGIREREKKSIEIEMASCMERVNNTPNVEQDVASVLRANAELAKQHEDLRVKLEQARLSESLESKQKGAQFQILDPANYPLEPASPPTIVVLLVGVVMSLAGSVALAVVIDWMNRKVWTHGELERLLEAPVLVEIPSMVTASDVRHARRRMLAHVALFLVFAGVYLGGLYFLYLKQSAVLRVLDPLIERISIPKSTT